MKIFLNTATLSLPCVLAMITISSSEAHDLSEPLLHFCKSLRTLSASAQNECLIASIQTVDSYQSVLTQIAKSPMSHASVKNLGLLKTEIEEEKTLLPTCIYEVLGQYHQALLSAKSKPHPEKKIKTIIEAANRNLDRIHADLVKESKGSSK